ncbi:oligoendopeptidase F [Fusibacter sp. JL216-2]|uniref:oligoendopeptidase F n=1 Tax=Fusibacter sp. JL216-2 TaxID=3071453 RepID=UPI003D351DE0
MAKLRERAEIPEQYKWDIESMYETSDLWEADFKRAQALIQEISALKGTVTKSKDSLLKALETDLKLDRVLTNIFTFARMKQDENTKNATYQAMTSRAESLGTEASSASSFIVPEILAADADLIWSMVESSEALSLYKQYLDNIMRSKPHVLSAEEEELLASAGELASAPSNIFGMLNSADLKFPVVKDSEGKDLQLSHGNFIPTLESRDRRLRQDAFKAYYSVYEDHKNALAMMVQSEVKKNIFYSKARKHRSARHASLHKNNVDVAVYDSLVDAVNEYLPAMHKYMELRKKALGVDALHMYDVYTPIVKNVDMKVPYEKATETVLKALAPLGQTYCSVVEKAYEEGWIDVYENVGKRSGAYSFGTYDSKPFILLNYHDTLDNMFTLAHEMGHSMHSYMTRKNQPYVYGNYSIFLAEVASTTNEALLTNHLLETLEDETEKLYLLNHYLESFRGTVFRQTMFAEFERDIHSMVESGQALTAEVLSSHYRKLNEKYYGPAMIIDKEIDLEWARIPHFYYNFYVFQYATGFSAAVSLSEQILKEGQPAVDRYLNFLGAGRSEYPLDIMEKAGADMRSGQPVRDALKKFSELVDEMSALLEE